MLKPMLNDSALLSKFFGVENANAARALDTGHGRPARFYRGSDRHQQRHRAGRYCHGQLRRAPGRVNQQFEDLKISIFQATGDFFALVRRADFRTGAAGPARAAAHSRVETHARNKRS